MSLDHDDSLAGPEADLDVLWDLFAAAYVLAPVEQEPVLTALDAALSTMLATLQVEQPGVEQPDAPTVQIPDEVLSRLAAECARE